MAGKMLCFPNGYRTTSDRLSRVNVLPFLSASLTHVYVEVFEKGHSVYRGLIDLDQVEVTARDAARDMELES
jgi:hypothetical protein